MSRYIDADAFKRKLIDEKHFFPAIVAKALEEMPTVDIDQTKTSFQEDLEFFVNDCTEAQLKALYERVGEKIRAKKKPDFTNHDGSHDYD